MSLVLSSEHEDFQQSVRSFLERNVTEDKTRQLVDSDDGLDEALWNSFTDLELHALGVPEEMGGAGGSWVELGLVLEEMGAVLVCSPFFASTVLAAQALRELGPNNEYRGWMDRIRQGELTATLSLPTSGNGYGGVTDLNLTAEEADGSFRLSGTDAQIIDGATAGLTIVAARTGEGRGLFAVERPEPEARATPRSTLDPTRKVASVSFSDVPAVRLEADDARYERILDLARIGLAAEQLGGARRCLQLAVEYAKDRTQHGQPIGSFQAIKHRCADSYVAIEAARPAVYHALLVAAELDAPLEAAASVAKILASQAFTRAATSSVQIHGGIGYTWEHPAHLYLRRGKSSEILLGTPANLQERLSSCLPMR